MNSTLICLLGLSSIGQIDFDGGLLAGGITSQVHGDGYGGFNKVGISAGAFVLLGFNETSALRIDMLFAQKGSRNKPDTEAGDFTTFKLQLDYIEIPVLYSWTFRDEISFEVGPYAARLVNSGQENNGNDFEINPPYNDWDIGACAGFSYEITPRLLGVARYTQSILPIRDKPSGAQQTTTWNAGGYNYALSLMFGYKL